MVGCLYRDVNFTKRYTCKRRRKRRFKDVVFYC